MVHCIIGFLINAALWNVSFIPHYHSFFHKKIFFLNVYISVNTIFEYLFMFFRCKRSHQLSTYATGGVMGGSSRMRTAAYRGRRCHASCVCKHLHYLFSCFWQRFCFIVSCFFCRNWTLPSFKKDVFVRNGYFSPTRSISVIMK